MDQWPPKYVLPSSAGINRNLESDTFLHMR